MPHLTLGRFPWAVDATRWLRVLDTYAGPAWVAADVTVVASHLPRERGHRPRHEVLARLPLGDEAPSRRRPRRESRRDTYTGGGIPGRVPGPRSSAG